MMTDTLYITQPDGLCYTFRDGLLYPVYPYHWTHTDRDGDYARYKGTPLALPVPEAEAAPLLEQIRAWHPMADEALELPRDNTSELLEWVSALHLRWALQGLDCILWQGLRYVVSEEEDLPPALEETPYATLPWGMLLHEHPFHPLLDPVRVSPYAAPDWAVITQACRALEARQDFAGRHASIRDLRALIQEDYHDAI